MVASMVVLPTPFRPSTARAWRSSSENPTSSSTTVAPYPARIESSLSASGMPLSEINLVHAHVVRDLFRRAFA